MKFSIKLNTIKSGWSFLYIEGSQVIISPQNILYLFSLKMDFVSANNADLDEMSLYAALQ